MALSTSEKLPFTPDLVIQNPKKGTKPHLLLKKYNKLSL